MKSTSSSTEIKVGIFVFVAIILGFAVVFAVGSKSNVFVAKTEYETVFHHVGGLRTGSVVRISGVDVGTVNSIDFGKDAKIHVRFGVRNDARDLIRTDSVATISSKGMLGDQLLHINAGTENPIPPGGTVPSSETVAVSQYLNQAGKILSSAEDTARNINIGTEALGDPQFGEDIRNVARNLAEVLEMIAVGDGPLNRMITDRRWSRDLEQILGNMKASTTELAITAENMRAISHEIRYGDGSAHELIYGQEGSQLVTNLSNATQELATILQDVRTTDGTIHQLLYENSADNLLSNLTDISTDLKAISQDIRAGKGTLGALLVDPSVYEDIKRLVGNLERNEILRALVRYSIRQDEKKKEAEVTPVPQ